MIPCCCVCGKSAKAWNDEWTGLQDFCGKHMMLIERNNGELKEYVNEQFEEMEYSSPRTLSMLKSSLKRI